MVSIFLCLDAPAQELILADNFSQKMGWTSFNSFPRLLADVNGDGRRDIIGFAGDGVYVSVFDSTWVPSKPAKWLGGYAVSAGGWTTYDQFPRQAADVNGDGRADIIGFANDGVYVSLSTGSNFQAPAKWNDGFCTGKGWTSNNITPRFAGDVNGDHKADIIGFAADGAYVSLSTGTGFAPPTKWSEDFKPIGYPEQDKFPRAIGDVNGDGKGDVIGFAATGVFVALSNGNGFSPATKWTALFVQDNKSSNVEPRIVADVNNDGMGDVVGFTQDGVYVSLSNGTSFIQPVKWLAGMAPQIGGWTDQNTFPRMVGDFNGDGFADLVGFASDGVRVAKNDLVNKNGAFIIPVQTDNPTDFSTSVALITYNDTTAVSVPMSALVIQPPAPPPGLAQLTSNPVMPSIDRSNFWWNSSNKPTLECYGNCGQTFADYVGKLNTNVERWETPSTDPYLPPRVTTGVSYSCAPYLNLSTDGKRRPGTVFKSHRDRACYACPATDEAGNFLITEADGVNATPASVVAHVAALQAGKNVYGGPVCKISVKIKPAAYNTPGLDGMGLRVKDLILERKLFENPDTLTAMLNTMAQNAKADPKTYVPQQWQAIAKSPYNHEAVRASLLLMLLSAASKAQRTPAEAMLVGDMEAFIQKIRAMVAQQALDIYDQWKAKDDAAAGQRKRLAYDLSPMGNVPPDFSTTILSGLTVGATGVAIVGTAAAFSTIGSVATGSVATSLFGMSGGTGTSIGISNLASAAVGSGSGATAAGAALFGPALVISAAAIILSAWVSRWQAIEQARPNLMLAVVTAANQPVNLKEMASQTTGAAQIANFWAMALDTGNSEDPAIVQLAQQAAAAAAQKGYAVTK